MPTLDWREILISAISSAGIVAAALTGLGLMLRGAITKYIDKYLDTKFVVEMKKHEIGIENLKILADHARSVLQTFPALISNIRIASRALAEAPAPTEHLAGQLATAVKALDARLPEYFIVLPKEVHRAVHACKDAGDHVLRTLRQQGNRQELAEAADAVQLRRMEAYTELRRWADSLGSVFPKLP